MRDRIAIWFPLVLLAILAGLTFWLDRAVGPSGAPRDGSLRHDPDYIVDKLRSTRLDAAGRVKHTLHAERMLHYPDDDSTVLIAPKLVSHGASRSPLTITSRTARISANGENVYFEDDVTVRRAPYADKSELILRTAYLHVIPDDNIARTDRPVSIIDANTLVTAHGLELNSETRILKLQGRVKGTYHDPNRKKPRGP